MRLALTFQQAIVSHLPAEASDEDFVLLVLLLFTHAGAAAGNVKPVTDAVCCEVLAHVLKLQLLLHPRMAVHVLRVLLGVCCIVSTASCACVCLPPLTACPILNLCDSSESVWKALPALSTAALARLN